MNSQQIAKGNKTFIRLGIILDCIAILKFALFFQSIRNLLFNFLIDFLGVNLAFAILDFLNLINSIFFIFNFAVLIILATFFWSIGLYSSRFSPNQSDLISSIIKIHLVILFFIAMAYLSIFISKL